MPVLETKHKRKSAVITVLLLLLLLFGIFNIGMKYLDPPEEYGLAINFGDSDVGNGAPIQKTTVKSAPKQVEEVKEVLEKEVQETPKETLQEELITEDTSKEVPVVEKVEEKETVTEEIEKKEIPKETPKPSKATQNALDNLLNGNASDGKPKGEGDDDKSGVKGTKKGDLNSSKYYGNAGDGNDENYNLSGRNPLTKPIEQPNCEEEGIVVVRIEVDKNGKVILATPGVKGSTNTADCLLKPARQAALKTTWNPDKNAPAKQVGTIIYKFSLSK